MFLISTFYLIVNNSYLHFFYDENIVQFFHYQNWSIHKAYQSRINVIIFFERPYIANWFIYIYL
jgi:hypothetical protein